MTAAARRVLLVEDEVLIAMLVEDMLTDLGCEPAQTARSFDEALAAAQTGLFDLGLLDIKLGGILTYPVAEALKERGIPFAFVTGYEAAEIAPAYVASPILRKPFQLDDLAALIARLLSDALPGSGAET